MTWQDERSRWQPRMKVERDSVTGVFRATLTIHDQFRQVAGQWASVVEDWGDPGLAGFSDGVLTLRAHRIYAAEDGKRRWLPRAAHPDQWVEFGRPQFWTGASWQNLPLGGRVRHGNRLVWNRTHFAFVVTATWKKLALAIRLKDATAARRIRWPVNLHNLAWDNWTLKSNGSVVGTIRRPRIMAAGGEELEDPRSLNVQYSGGYVEFTADLSGLPYPIDIANTEFSTQPGSEGKDTFLRSDKQHAANQGALDLMICDSDGIFKTLIEFDCSSLDDADTCNSATLYLYKWQTDAFTDTITVYSIAVGNAAWPEGDKSNEEGVAGDCCWDYLDQDPEGETSWAGAAGLATSGTDFEADSIGTPSYPSGDEGTEFSGALTAARVEGWFGEPNTNYGILLLAGSTDALKLCTGDHATAGYRPKLVIDYTPGAPPAGNPWYYYAQM